MITNTDFLLSITALYKEMLNYKANKANTWTSNYQDLLDELEEVLDIAKDNEEYAKERFSEMILSQYNNFAMYVYATNDEAKSLKHNEVTRSKMSRVSRKEIRCPNCHKIIPPDAPLDDYHCACGFEGEIEVKGGAAHTASDNSKHTTKSIDKLIGLGHPTKVLIAITPVVIKWVTNLTFIKEWLIYRKTTSEWLMKFNNALGTSLTYDQVFSNDAMLIQRVPERRWSNEVFKLFTDELYYMLEYCQKLNNASNSNMVSMQPDDIIDVCIAYSEEFGGKLPPSSNTEYEYEGKKYDIGKFFNYLKLIYNNDTYPVKQDIEDIFNTHILAPGLMDDFCVIKTGINKFPQKFQYGQEYMYFIHHAFNVDYVTITTNDKQHIINIVMAFNTWYKKKNKTNKSKDSNSPLLACTLNFILNLPYFLKYKRICDYLSKKDIGTYNSIKNAWVLFITENKNIINTYCSKAEEIPVSNVTSLFATSGNTSANTSSLVTASASRGVTANASDEDDVDNDDNDDNDDDIF